MVVYAGEMEVEIRGGRLMSDSIVGIEVVVALWGEVWDVHGLIPCPAVRSMVWREWWCMEECGEGCGSDG